MATTLQPTLERGSIQSTHERHHTFDFQEFLEQRKFTRRVITFERKENLFTQGDREDSVFYLQSGRAKISVVSHKGKEATITLATVGDFVGEEALAPAHGLRLSTVTALDPCLTLKIKRGVMIRLLQDEPAFAGFFWRFLLERGMKSGEFRKMDLTVMPKIIAAPMIMLTLWSKSFCVCEEHTIDAEKYIESYVETILSGLMAK